MPEIGHSSSSLGANAGSRGRRLVRWYSLTWPYARMPFAVTCRRARASPPKGLMLMKTARFLAGWGARGVGRSLLRSALPMLSVVCWTWHPAAKVRGETV